MLVYGIWTFCAAIAAFLISAVTGKFLIPFLHKLNFGQTILEEGPKWHKSKQGTPIMGGIMFIIAIVAVSVISTVVYMLTGSGFIETYFSDISREVTFIFAGLGLALANGLIGFIDDYTTLSVDEALKKAEADGFIATVIGSRRLCRPRILLLYHRGNRDRRRS